MTQPRPPITPERACSMLAKVQVKLRRTHLPDDERGKLEEVERLLQAKLRFYDANPETGQQLQDSRLAMYHLRRALGLPQEHPATAHSRSHKRTRKRLMWMGWAIRPNRTTSRGDGAF